MHATQEIDWMNGPWRQLSDEIERQRPRLRNFIRRRVAGSEDVEDILQDVFSELVETYRLMQPVEHVTAWLFRVAKNRITDLFRKRKTEAISNTEPAEVDDDEALSLDELLPSAEAGPEAAYMRSLLHDELDLALSELPIEQQDVFIAHEIEGRSFKALAAKTGLSVNTLLARKHYAVRHLRKRLQAIYNEFNET
ncbi:MAG TPA: sigma-70 family RNA polymerase sigma factor [Gammaproteobacteria bacterium]|nr:sigma-70 family RNA polymerase sigma factor [Gammaproteobacteria bacterium]